MGARHLVCARVSLAGIEMTRCSPHYPAWRWQHCRVELPVSVGIRILVHYGDTLHWVPVIVKPYRYGRGGICFPPCYRRGVPFRRRWRW